MSRINVLNDIKVTFFTESFPEMVPDVRVALHDGTYYWEDKEASLRLRLQRGMWIPALIENYEALDPVPLALVQASVLDVLRIKVGVQV